MTLLDPHSAAALLRDHLLDYSGAQLYAVLDMAKGAEARQVLDGAAQDRRCLVQGKLPAALESVMPILIQLGEGGGKLESFLELGWGKGLGVLISSPLEMGPLRSHLGQQLILQDAGRSSLFRFFDPRVARSELAGETSGRLERLFAQVRHLVAEPEEGAGAWAHFVKGGRVHHWDLRWGISLAHTLGRAESAPDPNLEQLGGRLSHVVSHLEATATEIAHQEAGLGQVRQRTEEHLKELERARRAAQDRLTIMDGERESLVQQCTSEELRLKRSEEEEEDLTRRMEVLAGAMGQNTLEVMTSYNRLRSRGANLGKKEKELRAAENEDGLADVIEELEQVQQELKEKRRAIEDQKRAAGEHQELEKRRKAALGEREGHVSQLEDIRAGLSGLERRSGELELELEQLARRSDSMDQLLINGEPEGARDLDDGVARLKEGMGVAARRLGEVGEVEAALEEAPEQKAAKTAGNQEAAAFAAQNSRQRRQAPAAAP